MTKAHAFGVDRLTIAISVILKEKEYASEPKKRGESHRERAKAWVRKAFNTNNRDIESCLEKYEKYINECIDTEQLE
ncbi:hypothetical protein [Alishewanella longhuensis]